MTERDREALEQLELGMAEPSCGGCGHPGAWTCAECAAINAAGIEQMLAAGRVSAAERRAAVLGLPAAPEGEEGGEDASDG